MVSAVCDSNARLKKLYAIDITRAEGSKIDFLTSIFGFHQIINELTHTKTSSSCISLELTLQPNLMTESGVHSFLDVNCHYHIIYSKFNLGFIYPPFLEKGSDTTDKLIQIVFSAQLIALIGKKLFQILT